MKKAIIITTNALSVLLILSSLDLVNSIAMFLIAGHIPGTNHYVSADAMLIGATAILGFITGRVSARIIEAVSRRTVSRKHA